MEMFFAVFIMMQDGENVGEFRQPDMVSLEECKMTLEDDRAMLLEVIRAHPGYENVDLIGRCESVGDPA